MKSVRFRFLAAALAVLLGTAIAKSQTPDAAPPMHGHEGAMGMLGFYSDMLGLSDAQQAQAKTIMHKEMATLHPLMQQLHQTQQQLHQYEQGNFDEPKVRALATQAAQAQTELMVQKTRIHSELYQILTPEQQTKLNQYEANRQARMQKHMSQHAAPPEQ
jgi:periplasmic protein CpxP/Spy